MESTMTAVGAFLSDAGTAVMNAASSVGNALGNAAESVGNALLPKNAGEAFTALMSPPVYLTAKVAEALIGREEVAFQPGKTLRLSAPKTT